MSNGYKIKSILKKNINDMTQEELVKKRDQVRKKNLVYKITCTCFYCKKREQLRAEEPTSIEYLLPGWVSFNLIGEKDEKLIKYSCPDCVDKIQDSSVAIENMDMEHYYLYQYKK